MGDPDVEAAHAQEDAATGWQGRFADELRATTVERDRLLADLDAAHAELADAHRFERDARQMAALVVRLIKIDDRRRAVVVATAGMGIAVGVEATLPIVAEYTAVIAELRALMEMGDG
jgi:hypothetical protein